MQIVGQTQIGEYPLIARGKVRDIYEIDETTLLIVTTDRMSSFDVVLKEVVPYKGVVLNQLTLFWMERFRHILPNHIVETNVSRFPVPLKAYADELEGRAVLVKKAAPLPVECVVRGYLSGSGWLDYKAAGSICGHELPKGLRESDRLETIIFTPSTKAEIGKHDINISENEARKVVGDIFFSKARSAAMAMFIEASAYAESRDIIIADTKFEFGIYKDDLILIDEVLTPDSSRFWAKSEYAPGEKTPSFDKQYLRDWLKAQGWDMSTPPPPHLPEEVIRITCAKYYEAYTLITGKKLPSHLVPS